MAKINKYEKYMADVMKEQEDLLVEIEATENLMYEVKEKHQRDYYKREYERLLKELYYSCLDIQNLFNALRK